MRRMVRATPSLLPLARGGAHALAQARHPPQATEPPRQLDVLHERDGRVAAQRLEGGAPHEDGLVAGEDAGQARAQVHEGGDHPEGPARVVEDDVEPAAHDPQVAERARDGALEARGQMRVGVEEEQDVPGGGGGARVHLEGAATGRRHEPRAGRAPYHGLGVVRAAAVRHEDLRLGGQDAELGQQAVEVPGFVQRGDDDRQRDGRLGARAGAPRAHRVHRSHVANSRFTAALPLRPSRGGRARRGRFSSRTRSRRR